MIAHLKLQVIMTCVVIDKLLIRIFSPSGAAAVLARCYAGGMEKRC